ncbi:Glyco 3-alpha-L-fucosyltransferase A, partial [Brachionus plicatilis]
MINKADLVIVHMRDGISSIPLDRNQNQRWVFTLFESPVHSPNLKKFNGIFNLTATYRVDSDFPFFYTTNFLAGKTDFAAAVISNCGGTSKRLELIRELQKYVSVNVFGKCGKPCPNQFKNATLGDCKNILATEYKFYFAFENSVCKDYITEKFY